MKTETKHTPGPWSLEIYGKTTFAEVWSDSDDKCVAKVWSPNDAGLSSPYAENPKAQRKERKHTARLIAAAPEMAEALLNLVLEIEGAGDTCESARVALQKAGLL